MRNLRTITLISAAAVCLASVAASAEVTMTIVSPADGKTVTSSSFYARLSGVTEMVVVRVDCAGATHFIMVNPIPGEPARPGRPARQPAASDSYLPIVLGKQELTASVLSKDGHEIVAKQKVTFTVEKKPDSELAKGDYGFKKAYDGLSGGAGEADDAWKGFCREVDSALRNDKPESWNAVRHQAQNYLAMRSDEFHMRLSAYADLADIYIGAGRQADAMRAAQEADRIYEADKGLISQGEFFNDFPIIYDPRPAQNVQSPAHFAVMARLYAMKGDLNTALSWYQKSIDFQMTQSHAAHLDDGARQRCFTEAAGACRQAGWLVFLLTNDMNKYQQWMTRADKASSGSAGGGDTKVNLLGQ